MPSTHHVLILDSTAHKNKNLVSLLKHHHCIHQLSVIETSSAAVQCIEDNALSLFIINDDQIVCDYLELIGHAVGQKPLLPVMVMTRSPEWEGLVISARAGATGFLVLNERPIVIFQAVQQMLGSGSYIHPKIVPILLSAMTGFSVASQRLSQLTRRESEVLVYIAKGFTCIEIADLLCISSHTVSSHVKNLYRKLAIHSKGEAVVEAIRYGLIDVG